MDRKTIGWLLFTVAATLCFMIFFIALASGQKLPPKKEATAKTWLAPKGKACPIFRYGEDTTIEEATSRCMDYCTKTKACTSCEKRSGEAHPICK